MVRKEDNNPASQFCMECQYVSYYSFAKEVNHGLLYAIYVAELSIMLFSEFLVRLVGLLLHGQSKEAELID
ncbi:hypothetical protein AAHA92_25655 [Salvia divinorum]|uniref:Uncharacterized protein n=1 Tax=Salvia divinorum TaxID=28513 RepID=A0ABD1GBD6_SALDI